MLGQYGLLPDAAPANLPINAWTAGNNVRFDHGRVSRAPAFRTVDQGLLQTAPAFVMAATQGDGTDLLIIANDDGRLTRWSGGTETDVTPTSGFTPATDSRPFTGCVLGNVIYVNRPDKVPYGYKPTSTDFETIPAWDSNWKAGALRSFGDYLIAINIVDTGTEQPQLLKWSNTTLINQFPDSFDASDPTKLAGETPLSALKGPLIDGLALKSAFILYGQSQSFIMTLSNDQFVFNFDKLFDDDGIINQNCAVEVDGRHYVFGSGDLYVHDGVTKTSIAEGAVKDWVFANVDRSKTQRCFVYHDPYYNEVGFCFVSLDADAGFEDTDYANRCAAYNYANKTWSLRDLPNVAGAALTSASTDTLTWTNAPSTWATAGGTWNQSEASKNRGLIMVKPSDSISAETILVTDGFDMNSRFVHALFTAGIQPSWVRRDKLDLSELGLSLRDYKVPRRIIPLVNVLDAETTIYVKFGSSLTPAGATSWDTQQNFNPTSDYKVDSRKGGRWLALEFGISANVDFKLDGYDLDLTASSHR
jgi:hypothetical protein